MEVQKNTFMTTIHNHHPNMDASTYHPTWPRVLSEESPTPHPPPTPPPPTHPTPTPTHPPHPHPPTPPTHPTTPTKPHTHPNPHTPAVSNYWIGPWHFSVCRYWEKCMNKYLAGPQPLKWANNQIFKAWKNTDAEWKVYKPQGCWVYNQRIHGSIEIKKMAK